MHVTAATVITRSIRKPGQYSGLFPVRRQCVVGEERRHAAATAHPARAPARAGEEDHDARPSLDIHQILKKLPHRYPFLLVDRVLEFEKDVRIKALKNVTINEPFFMGHFPARPVMPGVLMLEALAQTAALLSFESMGSEPGDDTVVYFVGIDGARFKRVGRAGRPADPGGHASTASRPASTSTRRAPASTARPPSRPS